MHVVVVGRLAKTLDAQVKEDLQAVGAEVGADVRLQSILVAATAGGGRDNAVFKLAVCGRSGDIVSIGLRYFW